MRFTKHWELEGQHAFLGASKYHWLDYSLEKLEKTWDNQFASARGQRRHALAASLIKERVKLPEDPITTLGLYVNDAIGFRMKPEVPLKFSDNIFGTTDAISFEKGVLRIHDYKDGLHPGNQKQLKIYDALFCYEYGVNPYDIEIINRIYQHDQYYENIPSPTEIEKIIAWMRVCDKKLEEKKELAL